MSFVASTPLVTNLYHIVDTLSTLLSDVVFFVDHDCIRIGLFDAKNTGLVHATLNSFETFQASGAHSFGVNLQCLLKVLKTIKDAKDVTFVQTSSSPTLEIRANITEGCTVIHKLATLDLDKKYVVLPDHGYDMIAEVATAPLYNTCLLYTSPSPRDS